MVHPSNQPAHFADGEWGDNEKEKIFHQRLSQTTFFFRFASNAVRRVHLAKQRTTFNYL